MNDSLDVMLRTGDYLAGRRDTVDDVLEIIDKVGSRAEVGDMDAYEVYTEIRFGVLALKGEQG